MGTFHMEALCGVTCTTTGTGATLSCGPALPPPYCAFSLVYADQDTFTYCLRDTSGAFEEGLGTYNAGPNTITRTQVYSAGNATTRTYGTPYNFSTGTRNLFVDFPSSHGGVMLGGNNLSDVVSTTTARTNLGLGSAALLAAGTANGNVPQLGASGLPAIGGSLLTSLPAILPAPSGTKMLFYADSAPAGWTIITSVDDKLFKITKGSGAGGTTGGTNDGGLGGWDTTWGLTSASFTLGTPQLPVGSGGGGLTGLVTSATFASISAGPHSHTLTSASTWRPPSVYCILASKN
jgi:hypothetical protein